MRKSHRLVGLVGAAALALSAVVMPASSSSALGTITGIKVKLAKWRTVTLSWAADTSGGVNSYQVVSTPGARTLWVVRDTGGNLATSVTMVDLTGGTNYKFTVTSYTGSGELNPGAAVSQGSLQARGYLLTSQISPSTVQRGYSARISGRLTSSGVGQGYRKVTLLANSYPYADGVYSLVASTTTYSLGGYAFSVKPPRNTRYRLLFYGNGTSDVGGWSSQNANVKSTISLNLTPATITLGHSAHFYGKFATLTPSLLQYAPKALVHLQRKTGTTWVNMQTTTFSPTTATYSFYVKPSSRTDYVWRVVTDGGQAYAGSMSRIVKLTVN